MPVPLFQTDGEDSIPLGRSIQKSQVTAHAGRHDDRSTNAVAFFPPFPSRPLA